MRLFLLFSSPNKNLLNIDDSEQRRLAEESEFEDLKIKLNFEGKMLEHEMRIYRGKVHHCELNDGPNFYDFN